MRRLLLVPCVLALALVFAACDSAPSGNAATFNEVTITNRQFERELNALKNNRKLAESAKQSGFAIETDGKINPELAAQWLAADIQQVPVDQEFERRNLQISPEARAEAKTNVVAQFGSGQGNDGEAVFAGFPRWFQDLAIERQARVEAVLASFVADDGFADDAAWAAANQQSITDYCPSAKVVSHILVKNREEADAVKAELAGGADFASVASATSTDQGSAKDGGSLGCVQDGQFVAPFEAAMNATAPGSVSDPVQTEFGFHVIRVDNFDAVSAPSEIAELRRSAAGARFGDWLDEQLTTATISVDPKWGEAIVEQGRFTVRPPSTAPSGGSATTPSTSR